MMTGRDRRLDYEYRRLIEVDRNHPEINILVTSTNAHNVPNGYRVEYRIHSICGIDAEQKPLFAERFVMLIELPSEYPSVDAPASFRFIAMENGVQIPHPWHPNIRYYGDMVGRVCLNSVDTFIDIAWGVRRVGEYLRYERYHALNEPPYPEDQTVASWVIRIGEPNDYIYF